MACGQADSTRTGSTCASNSNEILPLEYRFGQSAVALFSALSTVGFGTASKAGQRRSALSTKREPKKARIASRSARNQVSMACTIRNASSSPALAGLSQRSCACRCSQTECSAATGTSLSTRRRGRVPGLGLATSVVNCLNVCSREPPRTTLGIRPLRPAAARNRVQPSRNCAPSRRLSPPPSM